jgi:hypothetical protein
MQQIFRRFLEKESVRALLPKYAKRGRGIEGKLKLLESLKDAYAQLAAQKSKNNLLTKMPF